MDKDPFLALGAIPVEPTASPVSTPVPKAPEALPESDPFSQLGAVPVSFAQTLLEEAPDKREVDSEDLQKIGQYYKLTPEEIKELESVKSYFGGYPKDFKPTAEYAKELGKGLAGTVGRTFAFNLPQFIYKKTQENPQYREAIDTLSEVAESRLSPITRGAEILGSVGGAIKLGQMAGKVAQGAGTAAKAAKYYEPVTAVTGGAATGLGKSKEKQELEEVSKSAALGGALYGGLYTTGKLASAAWKGAKGVSNEVLAKSVKEAELNRPKIEEYIEKQFKEEAPVYNQIKDTLVNNPKINSLDEFIEAVPQSRMEEIVGPSVLEKITKNNDSLKAVNEALETPEATTDAGKILSRLAYDKYKALKESTESLLGSGRTLDEIINESPTFASESIDNAFKLSKVSQAITDLKVKRDLPGFNAIQRMTATISDGKLVAKMFDDKLGLTGKLSIEKTLDDGSVLLNRYTDAIKEPLEKVYKLSNLLRKSQEPIESIYKQLDSGNITSAVAKQFKEFFTELKDQAKAMDVNISDIENYVPKMRKNFSEYRLAFKKEADNLASKLNLPGLEDISESMYKSILGSKRGYAKSKLLQFKNELEQLSGSKIEDFDDFKFSLATFFKRPAELKSALDTVASATKARVGKIPDWALEKNVDTLAARWIQNTFRYRAVRDIVQKLKIQANLADKAGQDYIAKYLRNLDADLLGKRQGTLNAWGRNLADSFDFAMLKKADSAGPIMRKIYNGARELPNMLMHIQSQVYPNYLGLNPKSAIQNLTSGYLQNMPEIGAALGTKLVTEATVDVANMLARRQSLGDMLVKEGILPRQWTGEMLEALKGGIKTGPVRNLGRKALQLNTDMAMALFTKSEQIARATTFFTAKRLVNHMIKNPDEMTRILNRMSSGAYRRGIREALKSGNLDLAQKEMNRYMQSTNMFNYDRLNMSEYGRFMGPLFSIFSKWPTATAGKIAHQFINKRKAEGSVRLAQTLLLPWATLAMVDTLIKEDIDESDVARRIVGGKGLKGWTQMDSLPTDFSVREGLLATPIAASVVDLADAVTNQERAGTVTKWINNSIRSFAPGAGTARFLLEDLPLYLTGEKQDKAVLFDEE